MNGPRRFFQRTFAIAGKEVRHILRDPRSLLLALAMPPVMLLLFGFGVSFDLHHLPVAVMDLDRSPSSRALVHHFFANDDFVHVGDLHDREESLTTLVSGDAVMVLAIEDGFEAKLRRHQAPAVGLWIDGSEANSAVQAQAKAETLIAVAMMHLGTSPPQATIRPLSVRTFTRFNPSGLSAVFLVPGIAAYVLAIVAVMLTALTVAGEWERGSMAQLFATPVGRLEIVLGKLLPYMALGSTAVLLVLAVGAWVFDVPFRGSATALVLISLLFLLGMLGQGLLISIVTRNQMVSTQAAVLSSMLPSLLLSGFIFPIANMPLPLQYVSRIVPARYFVEGLRGVLLRGNDISVLLPQVGALAAFATVMILVSTLRFRRTVA